MFQPPPNARERYCQRCAKVQVLVNWDTPAPCRGCGGTNFHSEPKKHTTGVTFADSLTPKDIDFLRCQGIDPEATYE